MKTIAKFIVKYVRPIWSGLINILFVLPHYFLRKAFSKQAKIDYFSNETSYKQVDSFDKMKEWYSIVYKYKYDFSLRDTILQAFMGIAISIILWILIGAFTLIFIGFWICGMLDHENSKLEFFQKFGDCDDVSLYSCKKLKELGYEAKRVWMSGKIPFMSFHFDCLVKLGENNYMLFNYGRFVYGKDLEDCMKKLGDSWSLFKDAKIYFTF